MIPTERTETCRFDKTLPLYTVCSIIKCKLRAMLVFVNPNTKTYNKSLLQTVYYTFKERY